MDSTDVKMLRDALNDELALIGPKLGFSFSVGSAKYGADIVFQLKCSPIIDGEVITQEVEDFKRLAKGLGMKPTDLGRKFRFNGRMYTLTGCKPGRGKYPILCRRDDDRLFKFAPLTVLNCIALTERGVIL